MKKLLALLVAFFTLAGYASAANIADDFRAHYSAASDLSAYNKDINAMIGVADFHTGKGTTFPGFDIGATLSAVKPSDKNNITTDDYLYAGFITAETKIPVLDLGVVVRGTDMNGFQSLGGGLKYHYNLFDTIHLSLAGFYDRGKTDWYTTDHYSASAVASMNVLFFTPYVGVGYRLWRTENQKPGCGTLHQRRSRTLYGRRKRKTVPVCLYVWRLHLHG